MSDIKPIVIKAIASDNTEIEIFNSFIHGYDAVSSTIKHDVSQIQMYKTRCRKCGCDTLKVYLDIHNTGKKDLLHDQQCAEIDEQNWTEAFDWIAIDKQCTHCGNLTKHWFEMETM